MSSALSVGRIQRRKEKEETKDKQENKEKDNKDNTPSYDILLSKQEQQTLLVRAQKMEQELASKSELVIKQARLEILSYEDLKSIAVCCVTDASLSGRNSVNDSRMGVIQNNKVCSTCQMNISYCSGHLGMIDFYRKSPQPDHSIYHPQYLRTIIQILTCVCNTCSRLLLSKQEMRDRNILRFTGELRLTMLVEESKNWCCRRSGSDPSGNTEKEDDDTKDIPTGAIKRCVRNPEFAPEKIKETKQIMFKLPAKKGQEVKYSLMSIQEVAKILHWISNEDATLMGFENASHPQHMILKGLPVVSLIERPPSVREGVIYPHPLTLIYRDIVKENNKLDGKLSEEMRRKTQAHLFFLVEHLIDNSDGKYSPKGQSKDFFSVKDLLTGKGGIQRGLLMGKRVNYCARTVVSPDPTLKFGQVGIPRIMVSKLTQPEVVQEYNIDRLNKLLNEGKITYVTNDSGVYQVSNNRKQRTIQSLNIGDKVDRWLEEGDLIVFNRQPTLHKQSMMAGRVVIRNELTAGIHMSCTTPLNMDFELV